MNKKKRKSTAMALSLATKKKVPAGTYEVDGDVVTLVVPGPDPTDIVARAAQACDVVATDFEDLFAEEEGFGNVPSVIKEINEIDVNCCNLTENIEENPEPLAVQAVREKRVSSFKNAFSRPQQRKAPPRVTEKEVFSLMRKYGIHTQN